METEQKSIPELLAERSSTACAVWRLSNALRIIGYSILFLGPWFLGVFWLFDFLRDSFVADAQPVRLKEWKFYVILAASLLLFGGAIGVLSSYVKSRLERNLEDQERENPPD
jgi:hypothetical protein